MKLSENIECIRVLDAHPAKTLLAKWQEQAKHLESQNKNLEAALVKAETDVKERDEQIDGLKRMYNTNVRWLSKEREELKEKLESLQNCNSNQYTSIKGYQERVRQLREQLEAEKAKVGPVQDTYKDSKLEVRLLNDGEVQVLEYPANNAASPRRLRKTHALVDWRTKATRREVSIDDVDFKNMQVLGTITEYGPGRTPLSVFRGVPINGLLITTGA